MPMFDLVIFDCDGVLVDTETIAVEIDRQILAEHGWQLTTDDVVHRFMGTPFSAAQTALEEHLGHPLATDWAEQQEPRYLEAFDARLTSIPGIEDALDALTLLTCVASSGTHEKINHSLGLTGLLNRFQGRIFSASDVAHGKPAPDLFLHAAVSMGFEPWRCAVVEDSRNGVEAARAAGMTAFGYAGGLTPREWLEGPNTTLFDHMRQLPALLNPWTGRAPSPRDLGPADMTGHPADRGAEPSARSPPGRQFLRVPFTSRSQEGADHPLSSAPGRAFMSLVAPW